MNGIVETGIAGALAGTFLVTAARACMDALHARRVHKRLAAEPAPRGLHVGKLVSGVLSVGVTHFRDQRRARRAAPARYVPRVTLAKLLASIQPGQDVVELEPQDYADLATEIAAYLRYTNAPTSAELQKDGSLELYTPHGVVRVIKKGEPAPRIERSTSTHQKCGYCGAPGQRIGSRCAYCQVAVSR